jgi:integration host factor subunit beta
MNKSELTQALAEANDIPPEYARIFVETTIEMMKQQLLNDGRIEIRGFGSFYMRDYGGYTGRNPRTGKNITVKPKRLPFFKCGLDLKNMVNED